VWYVKNVGKKRTVRKKYRKKRTNSCNFIKIKRKEKYLGVHSSSSS